MRVIGDKKLTVKAADLFHDGGDDRPGFLCAQRAVHKVLLHIYNNEKMSHKLILRMKEYHGYSLYERIQFDKKKER